jgi:GAF domain-containing protein
MRRAHEYVREPFYLGDANWGVVAPQPEAESEGLKFADRVLEVNGRPVDGFIVYYVLAAGGVRVLQIVLGAAIVIGATVLSANLNVPRRLTATAVGIALIFVLRRIAERLRGWVDRRFFREAYEADAILSDLAMKVRTIVETGQLLETVATRIAGSMHVPRIAILLDGGGRFVPAYALGYPAPPPVAIPEESLTVKRLRKQQHAFVQFDDEDSWVQLTDGVERQSLEQLKPELLIPLSLNEKLLGIMSLGAKQSEEPFSRTDIRLLDSVAAQTGLALENGRLTAAITAEVAARENRNASLKSRTRCRSGSFRRTTRRFPLSTTPVCAVRRSTSAATTTTSSRCRRRSWGSPSATCQARAFPRRC